MRVWRASFCAAAIVGALAGGAARGAEPAAGPAPATAAPLLIAGPGGTPVEMRPEALARLPVQQVTVSFLAEHGTRSASFEGRLLWSVLQQAGAIDPAKPRDQVSETVVIIGRDGYRAVLGLGELAPEFEGKAVILAEKMDGQPLGVDHLRVVVPLDKRGGRSVRDVARIEVVALPKE
jgi:hypothetical protein